MCGGANMFIYAPTLPDALSENEVREATLAKAEYLCSIGDNVSGFLHIFLCVCV